MFSDEKMASRNEVGENGGIPSIQDSLETRNTNNKIGCYVQ